MAAPVRRLLAGVLLSRRVLPSARASGYRYLVVPANGSRSPWRLLGAVCLQRPAVVTQAKTAIQMDVAELMQQIEVERSLYADHEIRIMDEEERHRKKMSDSYESDDDEHKGHDLVTHQDMEDQWEQKMKQFEVASRVTEADTQNDRTSLQRKLDSNLVLLVKEKLGNEDCWLLPQIYWQQGETMRQTAERALSSLSGNNLQARFLGNAPCGFYKYKFPKAARTEDSIGAKVFFFKAYLQDGQLDDTVKKDYVWVCKSELQDYLTPSYLTEVNRFLFEL